MIWKTFVFAFFLAGVFADEFTLPEDKKLKLKQFLTQHCQKAGAADSKVDEITNSIHSFISCINGFVNTTQLKEEVEKAKPNGALDEVFKKYCAKTPQLKTCIHTLLDAVSPCVAASSQEHIASAKNGTDQLIDFVCYKDGDRIALFIAEGGPECFQSKMNPIRECGNKLSNVSSVEAAEALSIASKCAKFDEMTTCVVTALEQCETPTPANMADSLFRYIRKGSPCNTELPPKN